MLSPGRVTVIATYQCTASCDHCCFGCTPKTTQRLTPERLREIVDDAIAVPSIRIIGFVGGEPFLLGRELDELVERASDGGLWPTVTTNAYWAVNEGAAQRRLATLTSAGLRQISLSTGAMHARYVPATRIVHAAVAAAATDLDVTISLEVFEDDGFDRDAIYGDAMLGPLIASGRVSTLDRPWIPNSQGLGRADLRHDPFYGRFQDHRRSACHSALDDITIAPDEFVYACCGHPIQSIPDLRLGSLSDKRLVDILRDTPPSPMLMMLRTIGPERMYEIVQRVRADHALPLESVHACQTCLALHRDPEALSYLRGYGDRNREVVREYYERELAESHREGEKAIVGRNA